MAATHDVASEVVAWARRLSSGVSVIVETSGVADGDLAIDLRDQEALLARRQAVLAAPWSWLRQVHGREVWTVEHPGAAAGRVGDALVTTALDAALAVQTADCAPVVIVGEPGVLGVAHAGWRGVVVGVIAATVDAMIELGARDLTAYVGPRIGPECYEFSETDLDAVSAAVGDPDVATLTPAGRPALDLGRAVEISLRRAGVVETVLDTRCTACTPGLFSHRSRRERERQATVACLRAPEAGVGG